MPSGRINLPCKPCKHVRRFGRKVNEKVNEKVVKPFENAIKPFCDFFNDVKEAGRAGRKRRRDEVDEDDSHRTAKRVHRDLPQAVAPAELQDAQSTPQKPKATQSITQKPEKAQSVPQNEHLRPQPILQSEPQQGQSISRNEQPKVQRIDQAHPTPAREAQGDPGRIQDVVALATLRQRRGSFDEGVDSSIRKNTEVSKEKRSRKTASRTQTPLERKVCQQYRLKKSVKKSETGPVLPDKCVLMRIEDGKPIIRALPGANYFNLRKFLDETGGRPESVKSQETQKPSKEEPNISSVKSSSIYKDGEAQTSNKTEDTPVDMPSIASEKVEDACPVQASMPPADTTVATQPAPVEEVHITEYAPQPPTIPTQIQPPVEEAPPVQILEPVHKDVAVAPREPSFARQEPIFAPQLPAVAPHQPVVAPLQPVIAPLQPVIAPLQPVIVSQEPASTPSDIANVSVIPNRIETDGMDGVEYHPTVEKQPPMPQQPPAPLQPEQTAAPVALRSAPEVPKPQREESEVEKFYRPRNEPGKNIFPRPPPGQLQNSGPRFGEPSGGWTAVKAQMPAHTLPTQVQATGPQPAKQRQMLPIVQAHQPFGQRNMGSMPKIDMQTPVQSSFGRPSVGANMPKMDIKKPVFSSFGRPSVGANMPKMDVRKPVQSTFGQPSVSTFPFNRGKGRMADPEPTVFKVNKKEPTIFGLMESGEPDPFETLNNDSPTRESTPEEPRPSGHSKATTLESDEVGYVDLTDDIGFEDDPEARAAIISAREQGKNDKIIMEALLYVMAKGNGDASHKPDLYKDRLLEFQEDMVHNFPLEGRSYDPNLLENLQGHIQEELDELSLFEAKQKGKENYAPAEEDQLGGDESTEQDDEVIQPSKPRHKSSSRVNKRQAFPKHARNTLPKDNGWRLNSRSAKSWVRSKGDVVVDGVPLENPLGQPAPAICKFHFTAKGCRNKENCRFSHQPLKSLFIGIKEAPQPAEDPENVTMKTAKDLEEEAIAEAMFG